MASKAWCAHPAQNGQKPLPRFLPFLLVGLPPKPAGRSASRFRPMKPLSRLLGGYRRSKMFTALR